jgi:Papain family cysteine protease
MPTRRTVLALGALPAMGLQACGDSGSSVNSPSPAPSVLDRATGWAQMPVDVYNGIPQIGGNFRYDSAFQDFDISDTSFLALIGWPKMLPEPRSQGTQPSCTAWAVGYAAATQTLRAAGGNLSSAISPADLFAKIRNRLMPNACTQGAFISYAMDVLVQEGVATLDVAPYSDQQCGGLINASVFNLDGFSRIAPGDIISIRSSLQSMQPVSFGIQVNSAFQALSPANSVFVPNGSGSGHAMTIVGYDDRRQLFKVINSWGSDWGAGGYFWISYTDFARFAQDVCIPFVRRSTDNQLLSASTTNPSSAVVAQHMNARPYGTGVPGGYGVGVEMAWSAPLAVTAASISVLDSSQNVLFARQFGVSQIARGLRFGGPVPDGSAAYVIVRSSVTGRDSAGRVTTLTSTTRPPLR